MQATALGMHTLETVFAAAASSTAAGNTSMIDQIHFYQVDTSGTLAIKTLCEAQNRCVRRIKKKFADAVVG